MVEFRESKTSGHANVEIATNGAITLTGSPAAGTINVGWQWKYAGQPDEDSAWTDGGGLTITVEAAPASAQQAPTFDNEHGGTAADSAWERMRGTDGRDLFKIDDVPGANARAVDVPMSFSQSDGDMLRFGSGDPAPAADSVDKNLYVRLGTTGNPGTSLDDLFIYGVQGDASSLLAVIFNAGTTFELTNDDVWDHAVH